MTTDSTAAQPDLVVDELLNDLAKVPEVMGVLLGSQDGLRLAHAGPGMDGQMADRLAAVINGLYSIAHGVDDGEGRVEQVLIRKSNFLLFIMSAGSPPAAVARNAGRDPDKVDSVLGVLTSTRADEGTVAFAMVDLIRRMGELLATPARVGGAPSGGGQ
ncbi:roadblock/LC7 domain-containing protein [Streptomyces griseiscabiei]|uniref:Roadblock/LC7 domain-containing protein n=1 Tax=Streptomyces griseiscabiei TaxID=2993540 RepID=A0ABU4KY04_9ACTN|nr:roadblock/LC7 domain-containing protein [Streptomyces griseiscabiei]MBZ3904512.1 roadblock/LC7 domain-containing protein [Streptomyces griseiscabiei]MDX2908261.1 roadblock/LC7 domain-containing protein [Streptomyces griseiscabiei]